MHFREYNWKHKQKKFMDFVFIFKKVQKKGGT